ncbi:hypothetical protein IQ227_02855 [Anabaena aphanizomenioides LEGE 00250]|uniref:Uncharacterized protein n=1 Tax=Sphaerospermopsis aphanizomenoides LEGE 00250 TaxID=2777972 RepID=A0ABR9V958_9CYAN|nr:hypothetical protein [Sphaerospermopsis aphanizomenoides]MBE9235006.1 hypothetical protein [Sphaerospermopsis aphanizomenoides LEGE 00250]
MSFYPVTSHQSPVTSHQSPVPSHQSPVTSHQSPVTSPYLCNSPSQQYWTSGINTHIVR